MKRLISFGCMLICAAGMLQAQTGKVFPELIGESLENNQVELPEDSKGKITILGLAYSKKSEDVLRTWYTPMYDKFVLKRGMFDAMYDVNLYFIPMYTGAKKVAYEATLKELRESSRKDLFPYILFYKGSMEPYLESLKMDDKNLPYFFVLDEDGVVQYATKGLYSEKKMEQIESILDSRLK